LKLRSEKMSDATETKRLVYDTPVRSLSWEDDDEVMRCSGQRRDTGDCKETMEKARRETMDEARRDTTSRRDET
jgi:hypothetical protein